MLAIVSGINSSTALWYASRATGVVALLLLTAVLLLGLLITRSRDHGPVGPGPRRTFWRPVSPGRQRAGLHRNLSLLAVVFVAIHVVAAVLDGYVNIPLTAAVVPLASSYERLWLGLGAVSLDLMLAAIVTSLLRRHLSRRAWRAVHLTAYLSWPVAWVHSVFSGTDLQQGPLFVVAIVCAVAVAAAAAWRVWAAAGDVPRAERVGQLMAALHGQSGRPRHPDRPGHPGHLGLHEQVPDRERTLSK
jgi:DMSO/TMAO reductase YedYZ heme-binding membrane subunit